MSSKSYSCSNSVGGCGILALGLCFIIPAFLYGNTTAGIIAIVLTLIVVMIYNASSIGAEQLEAQQNEQPPVASPTPQPVKPNYKEQAFNRLKTIGLEPEKYIDVMDLVEVMLKFIDQLNADAKFHEATNELANVNVNICGNEPLCDLDPRTFKGKLQVIVLFDSIVNLQKAGHEVKLDTAEGYGILLLAVRMLGLEIDCYEHPELLLNQQFLDPLNDFISELAQNKISNSDFALSQMLNSYNADLDRQYRVLMYRYISLIANADGVVTEQERNWMKEVMEVKAQPATKQIEQTTDSDTSPMQELQELIGLQSVKREVNQLANLIKIQQQRRAQGLKVPTPSYHCVFTGNPGTGKTTVARILAAIYKELGILNKGQLVETDRSGLVAEYVGQTAVKTNKIIDSALDGVLFIDEAYSLVAGGSNDYGSEAIATLLKRMEDDRDRLVVILAGYTGEMQQFISSNPGLQSRFNRYIEFPDYSATDLLEIYKLRARKFQYNLAPEAEAQLKQLLERAVANKDKNFGNGRFARNVFDKSIELQANRLASQSKHLTKQELEEIVAADIPAI